MSCGTYRKELRLDMDGFCRFARSAFPNSTAAHLASVVGATVSTTEKWLSGQTRPSGEHLAAMIAAFGPAFLAAVIPATGQWAAKSVRAEQLSRISQELAELVAAE